jgi:Ribosome biogenesis protein Nop16
LTSNSRDACTPRIPDVAGADEDTTNTVDADLRSALGRPAPGGPAPPPPLTARQRQVISALVDKHGSNYEGMVKDTKLNRALHPAGKLRKMVAAFQLYTEGARVHFQQPKRRLL